MLLNLHTYAWVVLYFVTLLAIGDLRICIRRSRLDRRDVRASFNRAVDVLGCHGNPTVTQQRSVHVIWPSSRRNGRHQQVHLAPSLLTGNSKTQIVVVLKCSRPTEWQLSIQHQHTTNPYRKTLIIVEKGSRIKNLDRTLFRVNKVFLPSQMGELVQWATKKYGEITSLIQVKEQVNSIYYDGVSGNTSLCDTGLLSKSRNTSAVLAHQVSLSGCRTPSSGQKKDRLVYVVEVNQVGGNGKIWLNLTSTIKQRQLPDNFTIVLVLRSSKLNIKWMLFTQGLTGQLIIKSSGDVVPLMTEMSVKAEVINFGSMPTEKLLAGLEKEYSVVNMYARAEHANNIHLFVKQNNGPSREKRLKTTGLPRDAAAAAARQTRNYEAKSPFENQAETKLALRQALSVLCTNSAMTASLNVQKLKSVGVTMRHLTLSDPRCNASTNTSHFILTTKLAGCQTSLKHNRGYTNFINQIRVNCLSNDEKVSGCRHGQQDSNIISMSFNCTYYVSESGVHRNPGITMGAVNDDNGLYELSVYPNELYSRLYRRGYPQSGPLYVEASLTTPDGEHGLLVQNCWLSDSDQGNIVLQRQRHDLVKDGCGVDPSVELLPLQSLIPSGRDKHHTRYRFKFNMRRFFTKNLHFIKCQLDMCQFREKIGRITVNMCDHVEARCMGSRNVGPSQPQVKVFGPIMANKSPRGISVSHRSVTPTKAVRDKGDPPLFVKAEPVKPITPVTKVNKIVHGLETGTVVWIAFAAFTVGVLLTAALWFIHTHTDPRRRHELQRRLPTCQHRHCAAHSESSGGTTPCSSAPIHR